MTFNQFVFSFYSRLRQRGLPLTIEEYKVLLDAMQKGLGIESKDDFVTTCQLLWGKSEDQYLFISSEFHGYYSPLIEQIIGNQEKPEKIKDTKSRKHIDFESTEKKDTGNQNVAPERTSNGEPNLNKNTEDSKSDFKSPEFRQENAPMVAFYPFEDENFVGKAINTQLNATESNYIDSPFILNDDFLPISIRHAQQAWRKLRYYTSSLKNKENIDWQQTIEQTAQQGFLIEPTYIKSRKNKLNLTILIDVQGSMTIHWPIGKRIIDAALGEGGYSNANIYFTHNIPSNFLYKNSNLTESISINNVLEKIPSQHSVFLFFSDAGASRGRFNAKRVLITKQFVGLLKSKVQSIAWLNPMPQFRWKDTSAELIKRLVPMFECTESGIDAAIKALKTKKNARY